MKMTQIEFQDCLIKMGVDADSISIHGWEVQVKIADKKYSVWPTTGKWRDNKLGTIYHGLVPFSERIADEMKQCGMSKSDPDERPEIASIARNAKWIEPFELAKHSAELEKRTIMNCIGDLLKEIPRGGNAQITISPVDVEEINATGRTLRVIVEAKYFKVGKDDRNE